MNSPSYIKPTLGIQLFGENIYLWNICLKLLNRVKENIRANESEMCEEKYTSLCRTAASALAVPAPPAALAAGPGRAAAAALSTLPWVGWGRERER